jgi:hypothetical protein
LPGNGAGHYDTTIGWLLEARRTGRLPADPGVSPALREELVLRLGLAQPDARPAVPASCPRLRGVVHLQPPQGAQFALDGVLWAFLTRGGRVVAGPVAYDSGYGTRLLVTLPGLDLAVQPVPGRAPPRLCSI